MELITDLSKLQAAAEPLEFLTNTGIDKAEGEKIIKKLKKHLKDNNTEVAVAAPQLGIGKRIFCIKFQDTIKTFINPIITKKSKYNIQPESFSSMPGKEILISRPEELTVVYYTDEFKYEENKLLGIAARVFEQNCQLLDGITPDVLGVVSDIEEDGSLWDLDDEELAQIKEMYKQIIAARTEAMKAQVKADPELDKKYTELAFTEKVINGEANIVGRNISKKGQATAALSIKRSSQQAHLRNRAERVHFINQKRK